jgi:hypothetical protein
MHMAMDAPGTTHGPSEGTEDTLQLIASNPDTISGEDLPAGSCLTEQCVAHLAAPTPRCQPASRAPVKLLSFWPSRLCATLSTTCAAISSATLRSMRRRFMSSSAGARSAALSALLPTTLSASLPTKLPSRPRLAVAAALPLAEACTSRRAER